MVSHIKCNRRFCSVLGSDKNNVQAIVSRVEGKLRAGMETSAAVQFGGN